MAKFAGRGYVERANILHLGACNVNGAQTTFGKDFPMGEGWYKMVLDFAITVTIGTGTGAISEGELAFIKNVMLKTDRGEILCNLPGRALYKIATYRTSSAPNKDAIAAASATYHVYLPILFVDEKMVRMEDTILDTSRYNSVTLQVTLGSVADLFTTVGTSSVTATLDVEVARSLGPLPPAAKPHFHVSYDYRQPVDASISTEIDLERSADMSVKRYYVHSCTGGTAGVPFSGVNSDAVQNQVIIKDQNRFIEKDRVHRMIQNENKDEAWLENPIVGLEVFNFVRDGSITSALATGAKSVLKYSWSNQAGVAANYIVTVAAEMVRNLK